MREFKKIGVVGSGTMGHGIAQTFAAHGYETVVIDVAPEALEVAKKMVASNVEIMLENEFITAEQAANTEKYLSYSTEYGALADADLVIEAVPEVPQIKASVYASLDQACRPDTVFASTTSAMNVYDVVQVSNPERVLIAHFNNPSHVIPLVEVVAGPNTQKELLDDIRALLLSIGKAPAVLNKYVPGFIVNRLTAALLRECSYLV
ncbi:MAG: 3-hydroxyacyl-CoA dehydrogenase family protein, partial [Peptococcaceae bacterium]|nr:3-hydroxyacyl-CoA dehydrogenase family protein [Peptococcaceae bacterium]